MIDPYKLTNYELNTGQLEAYLLFAIGVAGKTAKIISKQLDTLLENNYITPFNKIKSFHNVDNLRERMKNIGFGCHKIKSKAFWEVANSNINLKSCTVEELEKLPGIGPKTSRFFLLHTRKDIKIAVLDTHILKYMKEIGYDVPKNTPSGKQYLKIEQQFLELAKDQNLAEFDLMIWNKYAK